MPQQPAVLYIRELPGGGYVAIEGQPGLTADAPYHALLSVERRTDPHRRDGHEPPVVVEADGRSQVEVFDQLVEIANSNVAVASALLRWEGARRAGRAP